MVGEDPAGKSFGTAAAGKFVGDAPAFTGATGGIVGAEPAGPACKAGADKLVGEALGIAGFGGGATASVEFSAPRIPGIGGPAGLEFAGVEPGEPIGIF